MSAADLWKLLEETEKIPVAFFAREAQNEFETETILAKYCYHLLSLGSADWTSQQNKYIDLAIDDLIAINNIFSVVAQPHKNAQHALINCVGEKEGFTLFLRDFKLGADHFYGRKRNELRERHIVLSPEYGDQTVLRALGKHITKPIVGLCNDSYLLAQTHTKINNQPGNIEAAIGMIGRAKAQRLPVQLGDHDRHSNMLRTQQDTWMETVTTLAETADAIILYVSEVSDGTRWEMDLIRSLNKQKHTMILYGNNLLKGRDCPDETKLKQELSDFHALFNITDGSTYTTHKEDVELVFSEDLARNISELSSLKSCNSFSSIDRLREIISQPFYLASRPTFIDESEERLERQLLVSSETRSLYDLYVVVRAKFNSRIQAPDDIDKRMGLLKHLFMHFAAASLFEDSAQIIRSALEIQKLVEPHITEPLASALGQSITSLVEALSPLGFGDLFYFVKY